MEIKNGTKSSLRNKILVSFLFLVFVVGISISLLIKILLRQSLEAAGLAQNIINNLIKDFTVLSLGIVILIMFSAILLAFVFSKYLTDSIKKLTNTINEIINSNNLEIKIDSELTKSKDEIGDLATAFNQMVSKLKRSYYVLEIKVQERN